MACRQVSSVLLRCKVSRYGSSHLCSQDSGSQGCKIVTSSRQPGLQNGTLSRDSRVVSDGPKNPWTKLTPGTAEYGCEESVR